MVSLIALVVSRRASSMKRSRRSTSLRGSCLHSRSSIGDCSQSTEASKAKGLPVISRSGNTTRYPESQAIKMVDNISSLGIASGGGKGGCLASNFLSLSVPWRTAVQSPPRGMAAFPWADRHCLYASWPTCQLEKKKVAPLQSSSWPSELFCTVTTLTTPAALPPSFSASRRSILGALSHSTLTLSASPPFRIILGTVMMAPWVPPKARVASTQDCSASPRAACIMDALSYARRYSS
mmetsp:Transcript_49843/g.131140  ORF Transcript_49843/g.131140 Transcript_49843/m.131140 type:complete len:237 (-) Transcript_49843:1306-2016(-)